MHTFVWVRDIENEMVKAGGDNTNLTHEEFEYIVSPYTKVKKTKTGQILSTYIRTTPGRILLNESFK